MRVDALTALPGSVGATTGGMLAYPTIVKRVIERGWTNLRMLDVCCGIGTMGLLSAFDLGFPDGEIVRELMLSDIDAPNANSVRDSVRKFGLEHRVTVLQGDGIQDFDGLRIMPFDLIISNPPHYNSDGHHHSADRDWRFHRPFFAALPRLLNPGGEAWLIEAGDGGVNRLAPEVIDHAQIEIIGWEVERNDPPFSWLLLRRK